MSMVAMNNTDAVALEVPSVGQRAARIIMAGVLACAMSIPTAALLVTHSAYADDATAASTQANPSVFADASAMRTYLLEGTMAILSAYSDDADQLAAARSQLEAEYANYSDAEVVDAFIDFVWQELGYVYAQANEEDLTQEKVDALVAAQADAQRDIGNLKKVLMAAAEAGKLGDAETMASASLYTPSIRAFVDELDIADEDVAGPDGNLSFEGLFTAPPSSQSASAGVQTGSGETDLTVQSADTGEHGGTSEPPYIDPETGEPTDDPGTPDNPNPDNPLYNPDEDDDGLGDNLAFTVPSQINFVMKATGKLVGPTNAYIENRSAMPIHGSALKVHAVNSWNIVEDAAASDADNSIDVQMGPEADKQELYKHVDTKKDVTAPEHWNMAATDSTVGSGRDVLTLTMSGDASHVTHDITEKESFGKVHWYVTGGVAE